MTTVDRNCHAIAGFLERAMAETGANEGRLRARFSGDKPKLSAQLRQGADTFPLALPDEAQVNLANAVDALHQLLCRHRPWKVVDFTVKSGGWSMGVTR